MKRRIFVAGVDVTDAIAANTARAPELTPERAEQLRSILLSPARQQAANETGPVLAIGPATATDAPIVLTDGNTTHASDNHGRSHRTHRRIRTPQIHATPAGTHPRPAA